MPALSCLTKCWTGEIKLKRGSYVGFLLIVKGSRIHLAWNRKYCNLSTIASRTIGSFSNDDGDGNENVKKAIGLLSKTTTLHVHHALLHIAWSSLPDYDVKIPNFTFKEDVNKRRQNFPSLSKLECGPQEINFREIRLQ